MSKLEYEVTISVENNEISGKLAVLPSSENSVFDPLTVLCDLLDIVDFKEVSIFAHDNFSLKRDFIKHPFFISEETNKKILDDFPRAFELGLFYNAVDTLNDIISNNKKITLDMFEVLKQFYQFKFTSEIKVAKENPLYSGGDIYKASNDRVRAIYDSSKIDTNEKLMYEPLSYYEGSKIDDLFERYKTSPLRFTYKCYKIVDIIFSVYHFLLLFKYKFNKCDHCSKYFATKSLKQKYCNRNSPYKGYTHLNCEQAVRNIKQKLARRRRSIISYFVKYFSSDIYKLFDDEHYSLKKSVNICSSVENLRKLDDFLEKGKVKERWYKKEYRKNIT